MAFHYRTAKPQDLSVLADLRWHLYQETNETEEGNRATFIEAFCQRLPAIDSRGPIDQCVSFQRAADPLTMSLRADG